MAFGKGSTEKTSRFPDDANIYYAKIRQKKDGNYLPAPVFEIKRKGEEKGKYVIVDEAAEFVSGNITEITNRKFKNAATQKETDQVSVILEDTSNGSHDVVYLNLDHGQLGWNVMNALLALKSPEDIKISLYQSKAKNPGDKTYGSVAVRQHNELIKGVYSNDQLPVVEKVDVEGTLIAKKGERTKFFISKIDELSKKLGGKKAPKAPTNAPETDNDANPPEEDVPF